jgi:uncharacterized RDD family membrane protein YckC
VDCPRCRTENGAAAIRCAGCGAPIALADESASTPLNHPLSLDRRSGRRAAAAAAAPAEQPLGEPPEDEPAPLPLNWEMEPPSDAALRRPPPRRPEARRPDPRRAPPPAPRPRPPEPPDAEFDVDAEVDAIEVHRERAPAWRRVASWIVDGALLAATVALLLSPVIGPADLDLGSGLDGLVEALVRSGSVLLPALLVVALVAFAYLWLWVTLAGATPGMRLAGLRVVGPDGHRPSPGRGAVRSFLAIPSAAFLGLGLLLALFTTSGRSAHDLGAGTWVVRASTRGGAR